MAGALDGLGYGRALGRFILEDGATLPGPDALAAPSPRAAAPAHGRTGRVAAGDGRASVGPRGGSRVEHRWKHASILAQAFRHGVPLTVHPGIGYDIIANHPVFSGAAIGRAARMGFQALRRLAAQTSTAASCSRSARPSWARRSSRKP